MNRQEIEDVLHMLGECERIALAALLATNNLKGNKSFKNEGLPELLRGHFQVALSLIAQAKKIWAIILQGTPT